MPLTCCDIPPYLSNLPSAWRESITSLFCDFISQQTQNTQIDCNKVKQCETLTSISTLGLQDGALFFTYYDENGTANFRSVNISNLVSGNTYTVRNGLNEFEPEVFELGGPLIKDTNLTADYDLGIPSGRFGVGYLSPFTDNDFKFGVINTSATIYNAGMITNTQPAQEVIDTSGLIVNRILQGGAFTQVTSGSIYGVNAKLQLSQTGDQVLIDNNNSAIYGNLELGIAGELTVPVISSITAAVYTTEAGTYDRVASIHVPAIQSKLDEFGGTIEEHISLYIETLGRDKALGSGSIEKTYGILQEGDVSNWFQGHVSISGTGDPESTATLGLFPLEDDRPRLSIFKPSTYTTIPTQVTTSSQIGMLGAGTDTVTSLYAGLSGTMFWEYATDQSLRATTIFSGLVGTIRVSSDSDTTGGTLSAVASSSVLSPKAEGTLGTIQSLAQFRATHPRQSASEYDDGQIFAGITNNYGVLIDDQRGDPLEIPITNSWGVYQIGATDHNYFRASVNIGYNVPDDKVAFQVASTTQCARFAPPMSTTQRDAMGVVPDGGGIYNLTTHQYQYYNAFTSTWVDL